MKIGNKEFDLENHAYVMGILNVTPDSFSDGGKWNDKGRAMRHTQEMIEQGATIIDIGGESTRPGYTLISDEEEISRVVPMIEIVKKKTLMCRFLSTLTKVEWQRQHLTQEQIWSTISGD